ncbi:LysR family transcriptional regulator [Shewanella sp. KX20019]|uniref:LysR family transcriptional regulator n=1 Tax=Shewanella sp. KX20019 TaxID=2803864 RepID=UPI00192777BC|nr:LysR family transcriptional regulator [Shewanella sp. KX20019]QQX80783.1 LysR family transcriptional regulator [Shewanella sp. KX20019]
MNTICFSHLDLLSINILVNLYENKSVTKVSNKLSLSAPKVSRSLKHTREVLGNELFIRRKHGLIPNEFADKVYPIAKKIMACCSELQDIQYKTTNSVVGHFEISAPDILSYPFPKSLLSTIHSSGKNMSFNFSQWGRNSIVEVISGKIDFGICCSDNEELVNSYDNSIASIPVARLDSLYLVCERNHPLLKQDIDLRSIASYRYVECNTGSLTSSGSKFKEYCSKNSIPLDIEVELCGAYSLFDYLRESNAVTILPYSSIYNAIENMPSLHICKLSKVEVNRLYNNSCIPTLYLTYNKNNKKPNLPWLIDTISSLILNTLNGAEHD